MIKIVYFDNASAIDYLNIYNGGERVQTKEEIKQNSEELTTKAGISVFAKLSKLPFFGLKTEAGVEASMNLDNNSLVKTTIANTILTDFMGKSKTDDKIKKFKGFKLMAYKNSITFFKMFTPYLKMTKSDFESEGVTFDLSKMDESFEEGKGYYEMIAEKEETQEKYIFRFNIGAFRNNYCLVDLTKMDLEYLAVKVGEVEESMLDINNEIDCNNKQISSAYDIFESPNSLEVYDVILSGVVI